MKPTRLRLLPLIGFAAVALALGGCTPPPITSAPVTFSITVPSDTPADADVWITGSTAELGAWNGHGLKLDRQADGTYSGSLDFAPGTQFQWKVTRGGFDSVEMSPNYEDVDNRSFIVALRDNVARATVAHFRGHTLTGDIHFHKAFGTSKLVPARDLIVYLPPGYEKNATRRYPVLYMHDGQNLMDRLSSAFGSEWNVDETAESLISSGQMEPIIIVGVYNTADRIPEYTPAPDPQYPAAGKADAYGQFLVQEVKPFIDLTYRTRPEAQSTGLAGSSLGGLVSMYFGLTLNGSFTRIGVISPSVWWDNKDIIKRVRALSTKPPIKVWLDIGTAEGNTPAEEVANAEELRDALVNTNGTWHFTPGQDLQFLKVPFAPHNEVAWSARMDQILKYLYPPAP